MKRWLPRLLLMVVMDNSLFFLDGLLPAFEKFNHLAHYPRITISLDKCEERIVNWAWHSIKTYILRPYKRIVD